MQGGPAGSPGGSEASPVGDIVGALLEYRWLILTVTAAAIAVAYVWVSRQVPQYRAECILVYDPKPARPLGGKIEDVAAPLDYWSSREYFATQTKILQSRAVAERVVRKLDLQHDADFFGIPQEERAQWTGAPVDLAADVLRGHLSIEQERDTRLVHVQATGPDPDKAALIANTVADAYLEKARDDRLGASSSALEWLAQQLDSLKKDLEESEMSLHGFAEDSRNFAMPLDEQRELAADQIKAYSEQLAATRVRRMELVADLNALTEAASSDLAAGSSARLSDDSLVGELRTALHEVTLELSAKGTEYGPNHPEIQALRTREKQLSQALQTEIRALIDAARLELRKVDEVRAELETALGEANQAGMRLELGAITYRRLQRERDNAAQLYETLLKRTTETDLTHALNVSYARIVDRALVPSYPFSPRKRMAVAMGGALGLLLSFALVLLLRKMDRAVRGTEDVEAFGVTVLGVLPTIVEEAKQAGRPTAIANRGRDLIVHEHPQSPAAECCRTVRTNLTFMGAERPVRSLVVTSSSPREGKSTVTLNLGIALAQSGKRVLVVDTDLRRPRLHKPLQLDGRTGVTTVLVGEVTLEEAIQETDVPNLFALPAGPLAPNPAELLHTPQFRTLLRSLEESYDMVLYDSPPLTAVTDAAILAPQVDGAVLVVRSDSTTRDALQAAVRTLRDVRATILGAVVNDIDLRSRRYGQGHYYAYAPHYGPDADGPPPPGGAAAQPGTSS